MTLMEGGVADHDRSSKRSAPSRRANLPGSVGRLLVMAHFIEAAGRAGGAEHGLYNILRGIGRGKVDVSVACGERDRLDPTVLAEIEAMPGITVLEAGGGGKRFVAEQLACLQRGLAADAVFFPNYYVPAHVPRRLGRVAAVIHDMQYRHLPQYCSAKRRAWCAVSQAWTLRRADTVIAISQFVADDIVRVYGPAVKPKLRVIPNPISWDRLGDGGDTSPLDCPYILSTAAHYPHKNLDTLVRAFALVAKRDTEVMFVLCGQHFTALAGTTGRRESLQSLAESLGIARRVRITGYITDAELGRWYRHAAVFAFPSVFEGVGVPPVEALGLGLPTLTTRCTSIPEATLGLAQYVDDPYSPEEWAERLEGLLRRPAEARPSGVDMMRLRWQYNTERLGRLYLAACGLDAG